jgi:DNA-binding MarR family transcriptional regulator
MSQQGSSIDLATSLGYLLKETSAVLRVSMEAVLRPLGMSITHYSCLELLAHRPGLSNSELARGAFVTRQSMSVLLQALEEEGIVTRPEQPVTGRALPTALTDRGRQQLAQASSAVQQVEARMRSRLTIEEQDQLRSLLVRCVNSLSDVPGGVQDLVQLGPRRYG